MTVSIPFDNSYARLSGPFHTPALPTPVAMPRLIKVNRELSIGLGLDPDALSGPEGIAVLAGNAIPGGAAPVAMAYAGHQFGNFVPTLGDGRAILLGEVVGPAGDRRDIHLKGCGRTPFSGRGDGRAALGPVLREYLVSEAMAALGIPTTRALAAVTTGEVVRRGTELPGAVLTRVASSHIRVGTFQYLAMRGDTASLRTLADYTIARHYPGAADAAQPYRALLEGVIARQAHLVARWLLIGFVHGVMNTDNTSVAGETIDYGPCAFMDAYDPATCFSSIDRYGRYAYANQPGIAHWNLARLAECLLPLLSADEEEAIGIANEALATFVDHFNTAYLNGLRRKLGLEEAGEDDLALAQDLLDRMAADKVDFTLLFRRLSDSAAGPEGDAAVAALFQDPASYAAWAARWRQRLDQEARDGTSRQAAMRQVNPALIPRNHRVEEVIEAAVEREDFAPFEAFMAALAAPYDDLPAHARYAEPPPPGQGAYRTFCGT